MSATKRPPPDSAGNLDGRELALRQRARSLAAADAREGADLEKARARRAAEIEPELAKLRRRREALAEPVSAEVGVSESDEFLDGMASLRDL